nr:multiple epidermal growth factor-like domains protein 10 [Crassostrea gigas]
MASNYDASKAVDRNPLTCMRANAVGQTSEDKIVWWKVDLGGIYRIYSINILFRSYDGYEFRQRGRFAGFSLYVSADDDGLKSSSLCYKDGPQLSPLNFTTFCIKPGRYVTFYNERLDGEFYPKNYELANVYTELCEVIVKGCIKPGIYGSNCDTPCPIHCKNNDCHIQNGMCFECNPGWKGATCQIKCENGWYGDKCSKKCVGNCLYNSTCNHVTGHCDVGCDAGWKGSMCDKECENGWFGETCGKKCVQNCKNNSTCNHVTGHCDVGCDVGWTGSMCDKECENGRYGENCSQQCVGNCMNNSTCNHVTGNCDGGCGVGWTGSMCDKGNFKYLSLAAVFNIIISK